MVINIVILCNLLSYLDTFRSFNCNKNNINFRKQYSRLSAVIYFNMDQNCEICVIQWKCFNDFNNNGCMEIDTEISVCLCT